MASVDQTFEERPLDEDADTDGHSRGQSHGRSAALAQAAAQLSARGITAEKYGSTPRSASRSGSGSRPAIGHRREQGKGASAEAAAEASAVPVLDVLSGLLPEGLRRGEAVSLAGPLAGGDRSPGYLALALLAGALRAGLWCAAVGVTGLGGLALADLLGRGPERKAALARLLVAPEPAEQWAQVTAALADGVDLLLLRPPEQIPAQLARRIDARLRQSRSGGTRHSAALLVLGAWPGARLELRTARTVWTGLSGIGPTAGTGHLTGGQTTIVAAGRATGGRTRTTRLWLPTATGAAAPLTETDATSATTGDLASSGQRLSIVA